jgi:hypothetical protein
MSEIIQIALISSIIGGVVVALINKLPEWRKAGAEVKKIEAETENLSVKTLSDTLNAVKGRVSDLEVAFEKKIDEVRMLTNERDEQRMRIEKLESMVRNVIETFRAFIGTPKTAREREALKMLDNMEAEL